METPIVHDNPNHSSAPNNVTNPQDLEKIKVKPKLFDEESVSMFIDTLQPPFFDRMIGNVHSDFCQLIRIGERLENRFRSGKIKKSFANKVIQSDLASEDIEEEISFT
ncbi:hypothetical protein Lal_00039652 [Lupinus albus]|nr:hypothetical protein Lal_00039652 [Lupinus albus]